jgi:hypothetical protein
MHDWKTKAKHNANKEVLVFPKPARLVVAPALLLHSNPASLAECMGIGVKFYSSVFRWNPFDLVQLSQPARLPPPIQG